MGEMWVEENRYRSTGDIGRSGDPLGEGRQVLIRRDGWAVLSMTRWEALDLIRLLTEHVEWKGWS